MEYIIKTFYLSDPPYFLPHTEYYERETLEEAKECADYWAAKYKAFDFDYSVEIYELTNY